MNKSTLLIFLALFIPAVPIHAQNKQKTVDKIEKMLEKGIDKGIDKLKNGPGGAMDLTDKVLADGSILVYGITFDANKATIRPESLGSIDKVLKILTEKPEIRYSVEVHTNDTGDPDINMALSQKRAESIKAKLTELGISGNRLTAKGCGMTKPIADNNTPYGKSRNRRVEFICLPL